jgi:hypothetical protein
MSILKGHVLITWKPVGPEDLFLNFPWPLSLHVQMSFGHIQDLKDFFVHIEKVSVTKFLWCLFMSHP